MSGQRVEMTVVFHAARLRSGHRSEKQARVPTIGSGAVAIEWAPTDGASGGVADSLDEAKAAFRAAVGGAPRRCARPRAGQRPLSSKKADEKCST
jgi:hypothetical protein